MRRIIIAGNWKMNKCKDEALDFIYQINYKLPLKSQVETVIFPQATLLDALTKIEGENLRIGAQNVFYAKEGAYTGEISLDNISGLGVKYVLLGHCERRSLFHETDEIVNLKLLSTLKYSIYPIVCLGEDDLVKANQQTEFFLTNQLKKILKNVDITLADKIILAYEPFWAIGKGQNMNIEEANKVIGYIRKQIKIIFSEKIAKAIRIIYGGSVTITNVGDFLKQPEIDGILSGKASLDANNFIEFANIAFQKFHSNK